MRQTWVLSVLVACLTCALPNVSGQSNSRIDATPKLELTTEIVNGKFCESGYLRLELRLRYYNNSNQPVIISRKSDTILTYYISKTAADAEIEKYEQKYSP